MIRSVLIGLVTGMRSMTPIAVISWAARRNLPSSHLTPRSILSWPAVSKITLALAAAEMLGDKMRSAPDRIIVPGILARVVTGAIAGAAVAGREERSLGAVLGATAAVSTAYLTFDLRKHAIRNVGQTSSGLIEDALALSTALWVAHAGRRDDQQPTLAGSPRSDL